MKKILSFFAMSAIVLGMAFTFNACGGNDANNPEPPENPQVNNEYFTVAVSPVEPAANQQVKIQITITARKDVYRFVLTDFTKKEAEDEGCLTLEGLLEKYPDITTSNLHTSLGKPLEYTELKSFDTEYVLVLFALDDKKQPIADSWIVITFKTPSAEALLNGAINGLFTVGQNQQVRFSKGNLRHNPVSGVWAFAEKQYDFVGKGNAYISPNYDGWIDLFGWGTGNNPTLSTIENSDYATFTNWGNNPISNGGDKAHQWRTLTHSEWDYLLRVRANAKGLFGFGTVNGVNGLIILPDNWTLPTGLNFTPSTKKGLNYHEGYYYNANENNFSHNAFTAIQWADQMQPAGAVFLPAAGYREGTEVSLVGSAGHYWLSTPRKKEGYSSAGEFNSSALTLDYDYFVYRGRSVRLVQDVK